jgi:hypothetical protein
LIPPGEHSQSAVRSLDGADSADSQFQSQSGIAQFIRREKWPMSEGQVHSPLQLSQMVLAICKSSLTFIVAADLLDNHRSMAIRTDGIFPSKSPKTISIHLTNRFSPSHSSNPILRRALESKSQACPLHTHNPSFHARSS